VVTVGATGEVALTERPAAVARSIRQRVFSGIQPSGNFHLGNYLGAIRNWVDQQAAFDNIFCIVDLHALSQPTTRELLQANILSLANVLLASGLDPAQSIIFVQSDVREHSELCWLLGSVTQYGELRRMTQFKDKSDKSDFVSAGLFTYPALMAADILLYDTDRVPVGDDQRQHIELARDIAIRFNSRYGDTFVVPAATIPRAGARVMDLQDPTSKMSKSSSSPQGIVGLLDDLKAIDKKIMRAVTDADTEVRYDVAAKPGVSNLLSILAACTGRTPEEAASGYTQYGPLKKDTAAAVVETIRPIQTRYAELSADPAETTRLLAKGAEKARTIASKVYTRARDNIGLLPRA
jgi:tryptophanyl-tRNA synthetase